MSALAIVVPLDDGSVNVPSESTPACRRVELWRESDSRTTELSCEVVPTARGQLDASECGDGVGWRCALTPWIRASAGLTGSS